MYCICPNYYFPTEAMIQSKCDSDYCVGNASKRVSCANGSVSVGVSPTPCEGPHWYNLNQGHRASCNFKVPQTGSWGTKVFDTATNQPLPSTVSFEIYEDKSGTDPKRGFGYNQGPPITLQSGVKYYISGVNGANNEFYICFVKVG